MASIFSQSLADSIANLWAILSGSNLAPAKTATNFSIISSQSPTSVTWNPNFWGYAARNVLDFSGMPYDTMQQATLITPQHYVSDTHFAPPTNVTYYDHNTGAAVTMSIANRINIPGLDMEIGVFTQPIPGWANIAIYPIATLPSGSTLPAYTFPVIYTAGRYLSSSDTWAFIGTNGSGVVAHTDYGVNSKVNLINSLPYIDPIFSDTNFSAGGLSSGDSSNPAFLLLNNQLALFQTFWFADGSGPMWGNPWNVSTINTAINRLGRHGWTITTLDISNPMGPPPVLPEDPTPTPTPTSVVENPPLPTPTPVLPEDPTPTPTPTAIVENPPLPTPPPGGYAPWWPQAAALALDTQLLAVDPLLYISPIFPLGAETVAPYNLAFQTGDVVELYASQEKYSFDCYHVWPPNLVLESSLFFPTIYGFTASFDPITKVQLNVTGSITGTSYRTGYGIGARYR